MPSHYETLGVDPAADARAIRKAYLALAQRLHPDRHIDGSPAEQAVAAERMRAVNEAWRVLGDPGRRRAYDVSHGVRHSPEPADMDREELLHGAAPPLIRSIPWALLIGVLVIIFVFTAYASGGGPGGSSSDCVQVLSGPATTHVPCDTEGARRIVGHVDATSPCPDGTERLELPEEPRAVCLSVP